MNAINSWIRGCLPSKQTLVGIGQASAVLAMTAIGLRSIPFIKRNTNMLTTIGLGLIDRTFSYFTDPVQSTHC